MQVRYNDIIKSKGPGIRVVEEANPLIEGNRVVRGSGNGIEVHTRGLGVIKNNDIVLNRRAGVDIRTFADPVLDRNRLVKNSVGVMCAEQVCFLFVMIWLRRVHAIARLKAECGVNVFSVVR